MRIWIMMIAALCICACASTATQSRKAATTVSTATGVASSETREGFGDAVSAPIEDLNLRREEIPPPLDRMAYPYLTEPGMTCATIAAEIGEYDAVLGKDFDTVDDAKKSWGERGGEAVADLMLDSVRGLTTGFIPYRGLLREATGAASYERKRQKAYSLGMARRSYLKGLGQGLGCEPPAAPVFTQIIETEDDIIETPKLETREEKRWQAPRPSAAFSGRK